MGPAVGAGGPKLVRPAPWTTWCRLASVKNKRMVGVAKFPGEYVYVRAKKAPPPRTYIYSPELHPECGSPLAKTLRETSWREQNQQRAPTTTITTATHTHKCEFFIDAS